MMRRAQQRAAQPGRASAFPLLLLLACLLLPGAALAQDDEAEEAKDITLEEWQENEEEIWGRKGPFIGAGGVGIWPSGSISNLLKSSAGGFNVRLGLRTAPWFAFEVMYEEFGNIRFSALVPPNPLTNPTAFSAMMNFKGYLRTDKRLQPYALVGLGVVSIDPKVKGRDTGFGMRFQGGVDYHITKKIVAVMEGGYVLGLGTQVDQWKYWLLSGGLAYRF